ncbi:MAG: BMP family ABC transporter substrate-binding protein [Lachnospiraceae bacterium]|nr:BMP family ABC transporter substrate-binding protein [Lachnospiraceae bacterium]
MKKRVLSILLAATMVIGMVAGCAKKPTADSSTDSKKGYELALITDVGTIDDKSFNQGSWEGLVKYAEENNITHKYYKPAEKSDEACANAIDLAVKGGAKVIVCPGFLFEVPIYNAQTKYPDIKFIILDGAPHNGDYNYDIKENVLSIFYAEEQAGYLAGYAAVTEGFKKLGFMGGMAVPAVVRFGYGYIQGADAAAKELGLAKGDVSIKYTYVGNFDASPENAAKAASWYNEGIEVIFACGGGVGNSVMKSAETAGTKVIGVDVDQSSESDTVITSAMKNLGKSVYDALGSYYDDSFVGGKSVTLDAATEGIELPMDTSKFKVFTKDMYDALYAKLVDGSIKVEKDSVATEPTGVPAELVTVESIK